MQKKAEENRKKVLTRGEESAIICKSPRESSAVPKFGAKKFWEKRKKLLTKESRSDIIQKLLTDRQSKARVEISEEKTSKNLEKRA